MVGSSSMEYADLAAWVRQSKQARPWSAIRRRSAGRLDG
jgi:hypothetical protein